MFSHDDIYEYERRKSFNKHRASEEDEERTDFHSVWDKYWEHAHEKEERSVRSW